MSDICFIVVSLVGTRGSLRLFWIIPMACSIAFTPAGFPSTKSSLNSSANLWCMSRACW